MGIKYFMNPCVLLLAGNQNPDMNTIYLKTKELLYQTNMAREGGSDLREQFKLVHKHRFLNFRWFYGLGECI